MQNNTDLNTELLSPQSLLITQWITRTLLVKHNLKQQTYSTICCGDVLVSHGHSYVLTVNGRMKPMCHHKKKTSLETYFLFECVKIITKLISMRC